MHEDSPAQRLHCAHCGDVIGAYERMVELIHGHAQETSKAAGMAREHSLAACYHSACYARLRDGTV